MDKSYFIKLLDKYLQGNASADEEQFLFSYYRLFESEPDILKLLSEDQKAELKSQIKQSIWDKITAHKQERQQVKSLFGRWTTTIAAAAVIVAICTTIVVYMFNKTPKPQAPIARSELRKEHRLIVLPDGSTVIVSPGSKLNYPASFDDADKREVYLEGQAFFDIRHNPSKAFIVHTGKLSTIVLGTAFTLRAFPGDADITVTVSRGKVKVRDEMKTLAVIIPDQQVTYNKQSATSVQKTVDANAYLTWKTQDILFDDVTVVKAAELLEERFNVKIFFSDELIKSNRFTTIFQKDESLDKVLKSICEFNGAVYEYNKEKNTVLIISKDSIK